MLGASYINIILLTVSLYDEKIYLFLTYKVGQLRIPSKIKNLVELEAVSSFLKGSVYHHGMTTDISLTFRFETLVTQEVRPGKRMAEEQFLINTHQLSSESFNNFSFVSLVERGFINLQWLLLKKMFDRIRA